MKGHEMPTDATPRRSEAGFTLIELMVVLLIIGILAAIAIPTYLGARDRAENTAAQSTLREALTTVDTYYASHGTFAGMGVPQLTALEPAIKWAATPSTQSVLISVGFEDNQGIYLTNLAATGICWSIGVAATPSGVWPGIPHPGTFYGQYLPATSAGCTSDNTRNWSGWHSSFASS